MALLMNSWYIIALNIQSLYFSIFIIIIEEFISQLRLAPASPHVREED